MKDAAAALYSGGKDSSYALRMAQQKADLTHVITVHASTGSYMYHVPASELAAVAADELDAEHVRVEVEGDDEVTPLEETLRKLDVDAVYTGAVESEYQRSRVDDVAERLEVDHRAPLWHCDAEEKLKEIVEEFEVVVTAVAADGLDESWLGRRLDEEAVEELVELKHSHGVHPLGEGGEFETLAVSGPHLDFEIGFEYEVEWDGTRGEVQVQDAWIERSPG